METPWLASVTGLPGTTLKRAGCGILMGAAAILTSSWRAWGFCLLSGLSGSVAGLIPAVARLMLQRAGKLPSALLLALSVLGSIPLWWPRLQVRLDVWWVGLTRGVGLVTGWGFLPIPLGFQDDTGYSVHLASPWLRDMHSVWMDLWVRFGAVGLLILAAVSVWVVRRTRKEWSRWFLVLALFCGSFQSAEGLGVMTVLALVWWIGLSQQKGERIHVGKV